MDTAARTNPPPLTLDSLDSEVEACSEPDSRVTIGTPTPLSRSARSTLAEARLSTTLRLSVSSTLLGVLRACLRSSLTTFYSTEHLFGASLQRSRRNSPPDDLVSPPVETAEIAEMLIDAAPETEPDFRVALSQTVVGSRAMRKSESGSSRSSVHSARTGKEIKARRAAAAKAAYKDEFADMAEEDSKVQDLREDVPEDFLFETPVPEMPSQESELKARKKALRARARERKKTADDASDAMSIGTPSDLGVDGEDEEEHSVLDRFKKKPFSLHLSLPGSNHSSRSNSPIGSPGGLQIGSPSAIQIGSPQAMVRGASSPTGSALSAAALSPSLSLNSKLSSGYNVGPPLDLASAHMIFEESIPRICTPEPTAESDAGHFKFDFLHTKPEVKSAPMYQTRHKHSSSSPGFGLKELREMRQAADLIERDAKRPTHSRSSSIAEKKLKRKPVPQQEGDELEVKVDTTKAAGGYFNAGFTFPKSKTDGPHNIVVSIGHESSTSARTSSESFESSTYPQTPDEFGMLSPVNRFGRRRSVSLSEMDNIAAFSSTSIEVTPPPVLDSHDDLSHAFDRVSFSPAGRPSSPHPLVGNESTPPASSSAQTSFFDAVSSSHSKRRHQRAPSFSQSPPVPNIPSPDAREVTGAWVPYSERRLGEPGSPSNPYGVPAKKIGMRRKSPRASPGPA